MRCGVYLHIKVYGFFSYVGFVNAKFWREKGALF